MKTAKNLAHITYISRNSRRSGAQHKHNILQLSALKSRKVLSCCGLRADVVVKTFNMVCS